MHALQAAVGCLGNLCTDLLVRVLGCPVDLDSDLWTRLIGVLWDSIGSWVCIDREKISIPLVIVVTGELEEITQPRLAAQRRVQRKGAHRGRSD